MQSLKGVLVFLKCMYACMYVCMCVCYTKLCLLNKWNTSSQVRVCLWFEAVCETVYRRVVQSIIDFLFLCKIPSISVMRCCRCFIVLTVGMSDNDRQISQWTFSYYVDNCHTTRVTCMLPFGAASNLQRSRPKQDHLSHPRNWIRRFILWKNPRNKCSMFMQSILLARCIRRDLSALFNDKVWNSRTCSLHHHHHYHHHHFNVSERSIHLQMSFGILSVNSELIILLLFIPAVPGWRLRKVC